MANAQPLRGYKALKCALRQQSVLMTAINRHNRHLFPAQIDRMLAGILVHDRMDNRRINWWNLLNLQRNTMCCQRNYPPLMYFELPYLDSIMTHNCVLFALVCINSCLSNVNSESRRPEENRDSQPNRTCLSRHFVNQKFTVAFWLITQESWISQVRLVSLARRRLFDTSLLFAISSMGAELRCYWIACQNRTEMLWKFACLCPMQLVFLGKRKAVPRKSTAIDGRIRLVKLLSGVVWLTGLPMKITKVN